MSGKYQPGTRVSEYILEERIGTGTFGEVWRGRHHVWENDRVAIKLPTELEYVRYLRLEGAVVHGLRHQNIIRVLGLDPYAETPYLVMELVNGPSLREIINEHKDRLKISTVVTVIRGMLEALKVAHAANVLHRDVKPGNVMLDLDSRKLDEVRVEDVKLGDFGLVGGDANVLQSIVQSASMHRDDSLVGTLAYMAPELRDGKSKGDAKADLYAVGVVLFELLTGERPAGAELPGTLRPQTPPALDEVFRRLYSRYDRRYASAEAVLKDLDQRLNDRPEDDSGAAHLPPLPRDASLPPVPRDRGTGPRCRACGESVQADDQFCIHCGVQLADKVRQCPSCNSYPAADDRFCIFCGSALPGVKVG